MSNKRAWRVDYWRNTFRAVSEHFKNVPSINPENGWVSRWSRRFGSKHSVVESIVKSPIILHVVVHRLIRNKHRTFVRELMRFRQSPGLRENKEWRGLSLQCIIIRAVDTNRHYFTIRKSQKRNIRTLCLRKYLTGSVKALIMPGVYPKRRKFCESVSQNIVYASWFPPRCRKSLFCIFCTLPL